MIVAKDVKLKAQSSIRKMASYWKRTCFLQILISPEWKKKNKKKLGISFKYRKLYFYQFFDAKFELQGIGQLLPKE